jgi:ferredoxin
MENGKAVHNDNCRQCGRCVIYCPSEAIHLSLENADFMQDIIRRISSFVDITLTKAVFCPVRSFLKPGTRIGCGERNCEHSFLVREGTP